MSGQKRLFMPARLNRATLRDEAQTLVGFTGDGHVGFTVAGVELVNKIEISHEDAMRLAGELLSASYDARKVDEEARGLNEWIVRPLEGGLVEVSHRGERAAFRPIVNGKRRTRGQGSITSAVVVVRENGQKAEALNGGHRCSACSKASPAGATMYVPVKKGEPGYLKGPALNWGFGGVRLCQTCVRPELAAAVLGAVILAAPATEGGGL